MFLKNTIENILQNIEADTEIIVTLDGVWAHPPIVQHERVNIIHVPVSIGQRAAQNLACRLSKAKYVMKMDAHCAIEKGMDRKMIEAFGLLEDNVTMIPVMRNLWAFDWKCKDCGWKRYQGPTPEKCEQCDGTNVERDMKWIAKSNPQSTAYRFDTTLHFQYWSNYKAKQFGDLVETLSLQGSCFMLTKKNYFDLNICDETWGSWGNQGTEVAIKTWLSGGRVIVNKKTYYGHMFRTQGGDFGFPYQQSGKQIARARKCSRNIFFKNKYERQIYPLSWLIEKFKPIPDWHDKSGKKVLRRIMKAGKNFNGKIGGVK